MKVRMLMSAKSNKWILPSQMLSISVKNNHELNNLIISWLGLSINISYKKSEVISN